MEVSFLLDQIETLQSRGDRYYSKGLFPSQRVHRGSGYIREDNNIFFSALIAFTLQQLESDLPENFKKRVECMVSKIVQNYSRYQHGKDQDTYNFWSAGPSGHFPYGKVLRHLPRFAIPDDSDDSCLIYLTRKASMDQAEKLKFKMEHHYDISTASTDLTPPEYSQFRAYPTFFGKKILREMDACVISNVLYFNTHYGLPWTSTDEDSLQFLYQVLTRGDYHLRPFEISPNYGNPALILYHMARLAGSFNGGNYEKLRGYLVPCLQQQLKRSPTLMEEVLLGCSQWRLQQECKSLTIPEDVEKHFDNFYFFQAGMLTAFQNKSLKKMTAHPFFHLKYRCFAYYWTLLLEYQVLKQRYYSKS